MDPADHLFRKGTESVLYADSFQFTRSVLEPTGEYRFLDSNTRLVREPRQQRPSVRQPRPDVKPPMMVVPHD